MPGTYCRYVHTNYTTPPHMRPQPSKLNSFRRQVRVLTMGQPDPKPVQAARMGGVGE